jgi:hypothetical protein
MKGGVARRRVTLATSHMVAGLLGVGIAMVVAVRAGPFAPGPVSATLGLAWMASGGSMHCEPDMVPWARSLVAHRTDLAEDDFAVEAAVALALLRDHGDERLHDRERATLQEAAARCSSALHVPCEGPRFDRAVARRCSTPKGHPLRRDAGVRAASCDAGLE